jgi:magnesium chelatase family protein
MSHPPDRTDPPSSVSSSVSSSSAKSAPSLSQSLASRSLSPGSSSSPESATAPIGRSPPRRSTAQRLVRIQSGDYFGVDGRLVEVQVDVSYSGKASFVIVGLAGKSTRESRDRIQSAIANSGFTFPYSERILVNLAPAFQKKDGVVFDLPVALGILLATGQALVDGSRVGGKLHVPIGFLGELGLQGELRPVPGALLAAIALRDRGVRAVVVPVENAAEVAVAPGIDVLPAVDLHDAIRALTATEIHANNTIVRWGLDPVADSRDHSRPERPSDVDFREVRGQEVTKRGLLIAAAGGHNLLMLGPPGVGKTMLACRIPGILPPMDFEETLDVLRIYSAADRSASREWLDERPFRAPHHTISYAGLAGGGSPPRPGEISLAHNGVLFLDELPEFPRRVLEVLRQPLEARVITISRSAGAVTFPAHVLVVAAMNPCPCGFAAAASSRCRCSESAIRRYGRRISGPLLDRIDLILEVGQPAPSEILGCSAAPVGLSTAEMRGCVLAARQRQHRRWGGSVLNSTVREPLLLREAGLEAAALSYLVEQSTRLSLSARGMSRVMRIARTLADLEDRSSVETVQISEALALRRSAMIAGDA